MPKTHPPSRQPQLIDVASALLLISCIMLTFFGWQYVKNEQLTEARTKFVQLTTTSSDEIAHRTAHYNDALYSLRAYLYNADNINNEQWETFITNQRTFDIFPGVIGLAYLEQIDSSEIDEFISTINGDRTLRNNYDKDIEIFPAPDPNANTYNIARFVTTTSDNSPVAGFNLPKNRIQALNAATESGAVKNSGPLDIFGANDFGFKIYLPLYENGLTPESVEDRREAVIGHLAAIFDTNDFLDEIASNIADHTTLKVIDVISGNTIYEVNGGQPHQSLLTNTNIISIAGNDWRLMYSSSDEFEQKYINSSERLLALGAGLTLTLLVAMLIRDNYRRHQ